MPIYTGGTSTVLTVRDSLNLADYGRDYPGAPPPAADHSAHGGSGRYLLKVGIDPPQRFPQLLRGL